MQDDVPVERVSGDDAPVVEHLGAEGLALDGSGTGTQTRKTRVVLSNAKNPRCFIVSLLRVGLLLSLVISVAVAVVVC